MTTTLAATRRQQREQERIRDAGLRDVERASRRGSRFAARMLGTYQARAIGAVLAVTPDVLDEQGISTAQVAAVEPDALLTGAAAADMMDKAQTEQAFNRLVSTLILDAARTASRVDSATRPAVTAHVRHANAPCCARCAVLAGRVYRFSQGFLRHPGDDCFMVPTNRSVGRELAADPQEMFRAGMIRDLSRADTKAINMGADIGQVVNVRRRGAGLVDGSSVMVRAGRPTPQGIFRTASDDDEALALLRRYGYVT